MGNSEILISTLNKRREVFFNNLELSPYGLNPVLIDGYLINPLPIRRSKRGVKAIKFRYPVRKLYDKSFYGFRFKGEVRSMQCLNKVYRFTKYDSENLPESVKQKFICSVEFSYLFYAIFSWISELRNEYKFKIIDNLFNPLLEDQSILDGYQFTFKFDRDCNYVEEDSLINFSLF